MNRIIFLIVSLLTFTVGSAEYQSMEFLCTDGTVHIVKSNNLVITVSGDNLIITDSAGETLQLPVVSLKSMSFTDYVDTPDQGDNSDGDGDGNGDDSDGINDAEIGVEGGFSVYTVEGVYAGSYASLKEAYEALKPAVYLLRQQNGQTVKILIGK